MNLKFIAGHYKYSPEEVIMLRGQGKKLIVINGEIEKEKKGQKGKTKEEKEDKKEKKEKHKGQGKKGD